MLLGIGAYNLDLHGSCLCTIRYTDPSITGYLNGINAICDNSSAHAQVVLSDDVCDTIARVFNRLVQYPGGADCLLNSVDSHVYRIHFADNFLCDYGLACPRKTAKGD